MSGTKKSRVSDFGASEVIEKLILAMDGVFKDWPENESLQPLIAALEQQLDYARERERRFEERRWR